MASKVKELTNKQLINPPKWLPDNVMYETIMGSFAYGVSSDTSDTDLYGFCMPEKSTLFPHLDGEIQGFGRQKQRFEQYQQHHIIDKDALAGKGRSYDVSMFNIVKYFQLCMENNPNMLDSIFTPLNCVLHSTKVGNLVRENRKIFLHKGAYHKFLGYAHSQLHKMSTKNPQEDSKRYQNIKEKGFDTKYAYHLVRLADECEQILSIGDINLQRANEHMKAVRRGEVSEQEIRDWFAARERTLEKMYAECKLQHTPDEEQIKTLLVHCLEEHYGNLEKAFVDTNAANIALQQIQDVLDKNRQHIANNSSNKPWWKTIFS